MECHVRAHRLTTLADVAAACTQITRKMLISGKDWRRWAAESGVSSQCAESKVCTSGGGKSRNNESCEAQSCSSRKDQECLSFCEVLLLQNP